MSTKKSKASKQSKKPVAKKAAGTKKPVAKKAAAATKSAATKSAAKKPPTAAAKAPATKAATKKPAATKPAAKKPAAAKAAAKAPATKAAAKTPSAKPAATTPVAATPAATPAAPLTEGLKHAVAIAANEVLVENLEAIIDDAEAFLDGDDLGATYQSWIGADTYDATTVDRVLGELSTWAPPDDGTPAWQRLGAAVYASALDVARALVHLATGAGALPPAVAPHAPSLQHVVDALRQAIAEGGYDDEKLGDLVA